VNRGGSLTKSRSLGDSIQLGDSRDSQINFCVDRGFKVFGCRVKPSQNLGFDSIL
jgi:hypothetical protein